MMNIINSYPSHYLTSLYKQVVTELSPLALTIQEMISDGLHYFSPQKVDPLASQRQFDRAFQNFPSSEMWRLFIDWKRQEEGADCFDREENGYRSAMEKTFDYIRDTLGKKLSANEFCYLHDLCIDSVKNRSGLWMKRGFSPKAEYGFPGPHNPDLKQYGEYTASREALEEAKRKGLFTGYPEDLPDSKQFLAHYDHVRMRSLSCENVWLTKRRINQLIHTYYQNIANCATPDEKLAVIADLCRALEVYHVFSDGNQRTIAFALLAKLLIENGFSPAILENPILFDGLYTTDEMVKQIKHGMIRFSRYRECFQGRRPFDTIDEGISFSRKSAVP